jgi:Domain of unknown function (DUF4136)
MRARNLAVFAAFSLVAGCTASLPPVEVTRFHLNKELAAGPVRIEGDSSLESAAYVAATAQAMAKAGFSDAEALKAQPVYIAKLTHSRLTREQAKRAPFSIGIGGGSFGRNVGVGVGTSIPIGGGMQQIIVTRLRIQMIRRDTQEAVWEGRAETEAPATAPASQPGLAAEKLANALFKDFPGVSGATIRVP